MSSSRWRTVANEVIDGVVQQNPGLSMDELRKKISQSYPFYERKYHPYKIWLSAVKQKLEAESRKRAASGAIPVPAFFALPGELEGL